MLSGQARQQKTGKCSTGLPGAEGPAATAPQYNRGGDSVPKPPTSRNADTRPHTCLVGNGGDGPATPPAAANTGDGVARRLRTRPLPWMGTSEFAAPCPVRSGSCCREEPSSAEDVSAARQNPEQAALGGAACWCGAAVCTQLFRSTRAGHDPAVTAGPVANSRPNGRTLGGELAA